MQSDLEDIDKVFLSEVWLQMEGSSSTVQIEGVRGAVAPIVLQHSVSALVKAIDHYSLCLIRGPGTTLQPPKCFKADLGILHLEPFETLWIVSGSTVVLHSVNCQYLSEADPDHKTGKR